MGRHKIFLVDDNKELLRLLARLVEAEGWQPITFSRGKPAGEAIATERPALALVDLLLPDMMGYDLAPLLRSEEIPFVFMTGIFKGGRAASEARAKYGAAAYFEKPFEARQLLQVMRGLLPPEPAPAEPPAPERSADELDMRPAVEPEETVEAIELTGKVVVKEAGAISAVIQGESLQAARVVPSAPARAASARPRPPRSEPPGEGELRDNLPDLVTAFWLTQQTGELSLQRGRVKKAIYFERGRPCFATSNLLADRFGPFLVRVGKLTANQLELCQANADRSGRKAGDVLVEMGILKEAEKLYYVGQQVKAIAYSLFAWEDGRYRLHFTDRASGVTTKIDIRPASLISRGVKKLYRPERVARLLGGDDRLVPTQQPAYGLHEVFLEDWEAHLLPSVDGTRTVRELTAAAGKPDDAVRRFLWSLVALEILEKRQE